MATIKLNEVFIDEEVRDGIKTAFNAYFSTQTQKQIDTDTAALITALIKQKIALLLDLDTIYASIAEGKARINLYITTYILPLVVELRNQLKSFDKEVAVQHHTTNFNPLDNQLNDVDKMPNETDDKSFSFADLMLGHIGFLLQNTQILNNLYWLIRRDCETILD